MKNIINGLNAAKLFQEVMHLFKQSMSKVFEETGFTLPQNMVLGLLFEEKMLKITDLSNKLSLSNSTVSGIIDRLENQGIVERKRSKHDKRVVYVSISSDFIKQNPFKMLEDGMEDKTIKNANRFPKVKDRKRNNVFTLCY